MLQRIHESLTVRVNSFVRKVLLQICRFVCVCVSLSLSLYVVYPIIEGTVGSIVTQGT